MAASAPHVPVMQERVVRLLADAPSGVLVDATVGAGGHARAVLDVCREADGSPRRLLGIDRDPDALALARENLADAPGDVDLVHARFDALPDVLDERGIERIAGILYDLGTSSMQLDEAARGFSVHRDGPLDMRMDPTRGPGAAEIVNEAPADELESLIARYGDERFARRIARAIVEARPLERTGELAEVVRDAVPAPARGGRHPAIRTFQALRIAVNDELGALERSLPAALERLAVDGIAVVIAYHSLEDRVVHRVLGEASRGCICPPDMPVCGCGRTPLVKLLTSRPERPEEAEIAGNPRARSALLRAARRLPDPT